MNRPLPANHTLAPASATTPVLSAPAPEKDYKGEQVLVTPRKFVREFFPDYGFRRLDSSVLQPIWESSAFEDRARAEGDTSFKQLIPYCVIVRDDEVHETEVLVYTRGKAGAEARLRGQDSIGVGGHINPQDVEGCSLLETNGEDGFSTALGRELMEEIGIGPEHIRQIDFVGLVNEDERDVGKVHLGLVYLVVLNPGTDLKFENCLLDPHWVVSDDLVKPEHLDTLELWSKIVVEAFAAMAPEIQAIR